jgi:hypothetical protein
MTCVCKKNPHTPNTWHKATLGGGDTKNGKHTTPVEVWTLSFKPEGDGPPAAIRVRALLKRALRSHGLRCTDYRVDAPAATTGGRRAVVEGREGR